MPDDVNEVQFCANVKSLLDSICATSPDLPFSGADIEVRKAGRAKRRDLVIRDRANPRVYALTGEVKLPDTPEGRSPYAESLVLDAHAKANDVGAAYFFTWNVNKLVLWETFRRDTPIAQRSLDFFDWDLIRQSEDLSRSDVSAKLRERLAEFLRYFAPIYEGAQPFPKKPLDLWFIHLLESALDFPTAATHSQLSDKYARDSRFKAKLDDWLKTNLGATIGKEEEANNLERAAKFSCYVLVNKIVFYDALRRKYPKRLRALHVGRDIDNALKLKARLDEAFRLAEAVTGDYETVFEGDSFGDRLPLLGDDVVPAWRSLIAEVDAYDFTGLDYDIIGQIFDGLIGPRERHRYGQHYTKSEIVDVINAFTVRSPDTKVLDPACGGGTFLVRAYARKKWLEEKTRTPRSHEDRLADIYGVDISAYATHLSTISLATRDLIRAANYPRIALSDFFDIAPPKAQFPAGVVKADGETLFDRAPLPPLDAIVGNPPYIRQELLTSNQKTKYRDRCEDAYPALKLSGRSDIHVYFWPYAASFLKSGGWMGFLTSSSWLDVEYGFSLQSWLLDHFAITAILESSSETWFTDARVSTAVTILRRESDPAIRRNSLVRFVQIRRHLSEILADVERAGDRLEAAQRLRDFLEAQTTDYIDANWRIRVVRQADLVRPSLSATERPAPSRLRTAEQTQDYQAVFHAGDKWGKYLNASDIFFDLTRRFARRFIPLGEIATVRYGLKSGCDDFFFLRDITESRLAELSDAQFSEVYGITRQQTAGVRVCQAGDESVHLIEARYLQPEVHSLMELHSLVIDRSALARVALVVNDPRSQLARSHVLQYIQWGERQGFHLLDTCASRETSTRPWYSIEPETRSVAILPKIQQYRHLVPINPQGYLVNTSLLELSESKAPVKVLAAVLNSTIVGLMKWAYGRGLGREANLQLDVYAARMMLVPDTSVATPAQAAELEASFDALAAIPRANLADELEWAERKRLDLAVLSLLGPSSPREALTLLQAIYDAVRALHSELRALELKARADRLKSARRGKTTPQSLAAEIWDSIKSDDASSLQAFPQGFVPPGEPIERLQLPTGAAVYRHDLLDSHTVIIGKTKLQLGQESRAKLLLELVEAGISGVADVPKSPAVCSRALKQWLDYRSRLEAHFGELAAHRTSDPQEQERIVAALWRRYHRWSLTGE